MQALYEILPLLIAMAVLIGCSAFFSGSEAALFLLQGRDRRALRAGTRAQRVAGALLVDPDRLLSAILLWNLVVNVTYFALTSIAGLQLQRNPDAGHGVAVAFTFASLMTIIFFSEMLPKSVAVLRARTIASLVGVPLAVAVRLVDPLMPALRLTNLLIRRLIWPRMKTESYLEVSDLERAIELSTTDAALVEQERTVLHNIVSLSEIRVDEWMRPRMQFRSFHPPVSPADLQGRHTPSGYLLVTEPDGDEVAAAIHLSRLPHLPGEDLQRHAEPVLYVPWCTTVADTLEQMCAHDRKVAAVVNELGETIGILTFDDLLDTIFTINPSRSARVLHREPIRRISDSAWHVTGMLSMRRLARHFGVTLPPGKSVTVAGVVQELMQRLPVEGDVCHFGPFRFEVIEAPERGPMLVELRRTDDEEATP